jgi:mono/diheme cytochrome c family protein
MPSLDSAESADAGLGVYREHCVQCHGAPGVSQKPFALGLNPPPANLVYTARKWSARELFWVVKHGIRMTGMPAWGYRLSDQEIWGVVAFMQRMPQLSPAEYAALAARSAPAVVAKTTTMRTADVRRGEQALHQYACTTCHYIPGVVGATVPVGPPLNDLALRRFIAGVLPNTPDNLVRWLKSPPDVKPHTAMPDLGVMEGDARDIAAFLYTLR